MEYRIVQILNNNVAIVHTRDNKQNIVMGRGVAFHKQKGDLIQEENVDKVFEIKDKNTVNDLTTLLANVPLDFVTTSYDLIDQVQAKYKFAVEPYIYVTLTTHLFGAYQRLIKNEEDVNYLPDLSDAYPIPYQIADDIITGFRNSLDISFPESEHKSIALHFINAHTSDGIKDDKNQIENDEIIEVVQDELNRNGIYRRQTNANDYDRLLVHLKYFINRLNNNEPDSLPISEGMIGEIETNYSQAWHIVQRIKELMEEKLQIKLSLSEQTYLTIHIQRLI
ncbi:PRD domain-containing protein [Lactobacillus johnsonii]|jgi:transcriptional antiterminator|uniref:PRD domain-containing protein n=1 Tax=Lactobacillus johnsonii TaxID=33959 RepID=UPI00124BBC20|nr:PRD domain-containing protein [Lactobacillus johnsonii]KAB1958663.1 PRD domain-containing protein [Lactobacillus johnsonii]MCT3345981.1 PRD domain-containing protein [Lactobacillus johnsonii]UOC06801.1 PRD domain-containing protein [Lactobacillus johnsonii]